MHKRLLMPHAAVYGFYLLVLALVTWPLVSVFTTHFLGHPFGDAYEYARHIWWIKHALQTGDSLFFQPLLAYPTGIDDVWLWGIPLQSFPAWLFAFVLPLPAAFNLGAVLTLALNGWALYWLVWRLTAQRSAAVLAGLIFMTYPHFQGQLGAAHTGLLVLWPVPFYVWNLLALARADRAGHYRVHGLLTAVFFVLSLLGSQLLLIYLVGPVTLLLLVPVIWRRDWQAAARMFLGIIGGGLLALVFFVPILSTTLNQTDGSAWLQEGGDVAFSADALGLVTPSFQHPWFSQLPHTHTILGVDPFERVAYVGIIAALLSVVGLIKFHAARPWLLLAGVAWVLSLGPLLQILNEIAVLRLGDYSTGITLPWLLLQSLPVLSMTRTPARFNFSIALAVALMAGYGAAALARGWRTLRLNPGSSAFLTRQPQAGVWLERVVVGLLAALILWEYQFFWPFPVISGTVPEPISALRDDDSVRVVFDVPWAHLLTGKDALFLQTGHQKPLLAGHVTRRTPIDPARPTVLQTTLDPALLAAAEVDVIILHKRWDESSAVGEVTRQALGTPFYEDELIAAFRVPEADAPQTALVAAPLALPQSIQRAVDSAFYVPESGWLTLTADLTGDGRTVTLWLDQQPVSRVTVTGATEISLPLPVSREGYHTLTLRLDPPCPTALDATLECRAVTLNQLTIGDFKPAPEFSPVRLTDGVTLTAAQLSTDADQLRVDLWWQFDQPRTLDEVRFVHVLDAAGALVAQSDEPLGEFASGAGVLDTVEIALDDLPPGEYHVTAGWYRYPNTTPFANLDSGSGVIDLGRFMVE